MLMGVRMPVARTMRMAVSMIMLAAILMVMLMVMSILMVMFVFVLMLMYMRMRDARGMHRLVLLLRQFAHDGLRRGGLYLFCFFLSSPRHYSTSSASTNTLMV